MSAPDTNIERQQTRHAPALLGIKGAMVFGAMMMMAILYFATSGGGDRGVGVYQGEATTAPAASGD